MIYYRDGRRYYGKEPSHSSAQSMGGGTLSRLAALYAGKTADEVRALLGREEVEREPQSWTEEKAIREKQGVKQRTGREIFDEKIKFMQESRQRRQSQIEEVPPPGPELARAIVRAAAKARGEIT